MIDNLDFPKDEIEISKIVDLLPDFKGETQNFINSAQLRTTSELLDISDLVYRLHWATRHQKNDVNSNGINQSIVSERHYAMNWITYYCDSWDEITTDT